MCVFGRILAWYAPNHEKGINEYLASHGVQVEGIAIRWSGLNPVVQLDKFEATGVLAEDIQLELDVFLSLWRNQFSLSNLAATHVQIELDLNERERSSSDSNSAAIGLGVLNVLLDSQNMDVRFTSATSANGIAQIIKGTLQSRTLGAQKDVLIELDPESDCEECGLVIRYSSRRSSFLFPEVIESLRVVAHDFEWVPHAWNAPYLQIVNLNGALDLKLRNGLGSGWSSFQVRTGIEPASSAKLEGNLSLNLIKDEIHAVLENASFTNGSVDAEIPNVNISSLGTPRLSHIWVEQVDTATLVSLIKGFGDSQHPAIAWIGGLQIEGEVRNLRFRHDSDDLTVLADVIDLRTLPYSAIPGVQVSQLAVLGRNRDYLLLPTPSDMAVEFPNWFEQSKSFSQMDGSVLLGIDKNHIGVRVVVNRATYMDDSIVGRFGFSANPSTGRSSMGLTAKASDLAVPSFQQFVPRDTGEGIRRWLEDNIEQGFLRNVAAIYHSIQLSDDQQSSSVFEARVDLDQVIARFHEAWPQLDSVRGQVLLTGNSLDVELESCHTSGILVSSGDVSVPLDDGNILVRFAADAPLALLLDYVQATPLSDVVKVDLGNVTGNGQVDIESTLQFQRDSDQPLVDVRLTFDNASLNLASPSVELSQLRGSILYASPFKISSQDLEGVVFGNKGSIQIGSDASVDDQVLRVHFESRFTPRDVVPYVGDWIEGVASGESDFRLDMEFSTNGSKTSFIDVESSLSGIELDLPDPLGKQSDTTRATKVRIELEDVPLVHFESGAISSVFSLRDDSGLHGSVGLNVPPSDYGPDDVGLHVSGYLDSFKFGSFGGGNGPNLPVQVKLQELAVNHVEVQDLAFTDVLLDGIYSEAEIDVTVKSNELEGSAKRFGQEPMFVEVDQIQLEQQGSRTKDPFSPEMLNRIPTMNLSVEDIVLVDQEQQSSSFGSWSMFIDVRDDELSISQLVGNVKGLQIEGGESGGITWNTTENKTRFLGSVKAAELHEVLPQWDYDANVESKALNIDVELEWPGSPLMFELYDTTGTLKGDLEEGRFLDVNAAGGALRITGLLNFAVVLQRLRLDFKDVFREGTSFNRILFDAQTDKGVLRFDEPLHIKTTGSEVLLAGTMDLNTDTLALDVVVTLPLTSSLPWWVGIATASPVAVISALVGRKIFEGQLDRMASMKYRVTGSLDDPKIQFVGLFRDSLEGENEDSQDNGEVEEGNQSNE